MFLYADKDGQLLMMKKMFLLMENRVRCFASPFQSLAPDLTVLNTVKLHTPRAFKISDQ